MFAGFFQDKDDRLEESLKSAGAKPVENAPNTSIWEDGTNDVNQRDLLTLFVRNQLRVSLALPLLAVLFAAASLLWTHWAIAAGWLACVLACQAVQLYICKLYQRRKNDKRPVSEWVGMLAASEFLYGACWSLPLFLFWQENNIAQHTYLAAVLMAVIAVRIMIASNYLPVILAGTGLITFNIVIRCIAEAEPLYIALGATAIIAELFFIQLARRLGKTARDMLIFKAQRERLISELEQARQEADIGRDRAEAANRAKSRFLATMSHELRTPLNAIMGFSEILSQELMGPHSVNAYKDYSTDIHHSGSYLLHLINDILDLSRIEAGRHEVNEEPLRLNEIADDCVKLLSKPVRERKQHIEVMLPNPLPKLRGDQRSIRQIWLNLLSNAVKFSETGTTIETGITVSPTNALTVFVRDHGPGMSELEIKRVLGAFNRGDMATKRAIDGAGLGLAIVNGLSKLHNGEFSLKSTPGEGTTASVTFPPARVLNNTQADILENFMAASQSQKKLVALTA